MHDVIPHINVKTKKYMKLLLTVHWKIPTDFLFVYLNSLFGVIRHIVLSAIIGFTVYKNFISVDWWKVH